MGDAILPTITLIDDHYLVWIKRSSGEHLNACPPITTVSRRQTLKTFARLTVRVDGNVIEVPQ